MRFAPQIDGFLQTFILTKKKLMTQNFDRLADAGERNGERSGRLRLRTHDQREKKDL